MNRFFVVVVAVFLGSNHLPLINFNTQGCIFAIFFPPIKVISVVFVLASKA